MIRSTVALAVLVAALAAGCGNTVTPSPSPLTTPSASPSPTPSSAPPSASATACGPTDLAATGGPLGGAAGSRGSDVVVTNVGSRACVLPASPTVAIVDPAGAVVLTSPPAQAGAGPSLDPGASTGFSLLIGNWCSETVNLPMHVRLALATDAVDIADLELATVDDLPPCNGPGQPATLSATEWQAG